MPATRASKLSFSVEELSPTGEFIALSKAPVAALAQRTVMEGRGVRCPFCYDVDQAWYRLPKVAETSRPDWA